MDCIYCGIRKQMALQEDALDSNFLYEYTVCLYENYMAKFFHSICAMHDLEQQVRVSRAYRKLRPVAYRRLHLKC